MTPQTEPIPQHHSICLPMVFLCLGIDVLFQTKRNFDADFILSSYKRHGKLGWGVLFVLQMHHLRDFLVIFLKNFAHSENLLSLPPNSFDNIYPPVVGGIKLRHDNSFLRNNGCVHKNQRKI